MRSSSASQDGSARPRALVSAVLREALPISVPGALVALGCALAIGAVARWSPWIAGLDGLLAVLAPWTAGVISALLVVRTFSYAYWNPKARLLLGLPSTERLLFLAISVHALAEASIVAATVACLFGTAANGSVYLGLLYAALAGPTAALGGGKIFAAPGIRKALDLMVAMSTGVDAGRTPPFFWTLMPTSIAGATACLLAVQREVRPGSLILLATAGLAWIASMARAPRHLKNAMLNLGLLDTVQIAAVPVEVGGRLGRLWAGWTASRTPRSAAVVLFENSVMRRRYPLLYFASQVVDVLAVSIAIAGRDLRPVLVVASGLTVLALVAVGREPVRCSKLSAQLMRSADARHGLWSSTALVGLSFAVVPTSVLAGLLASRLLSTVYVLVFPVALAGFVALVAATLRLAQPRR